MEITDIHEMIYKYLYDKHLADSTFKFTTRTRNNRGRLEKGYWFTGGEDYIEISFWKGKDSLAKINNIGFTVLLRNTRKEVYYNFSCKDGNNCEVINKLVAQFNLRKIGNPVNNYWEKTIISNFYDMNQIIVALDTFINNEKKVIDRIIQQNRGKGIEFIPDKDFEKNIQKIENIRSTC